MQFYVLVIPVILFLLWQVWKLEQMERKDKKRQAASKELAESFKRAWRELEAGDAHPIETLWDEIDED